MKPETKPKSFNIQFKEWHESKTVQQYSEIKAKIDKELGWNRQKWYNTINDRTPLKSAERIALESITGETIFNHGK